MTGLPSDREKRLAQALRDNLRRRKAQARETDAGADDQNSRDTARPSE